MDQTMDNGVEKPVGFSGFSTFVGMLGFKQKDTSSNRALDLIMLVGRQLSSTPGKSYLHYSCHSSVGYRNKSRASFLARRHCHKRIVGSIT